MGELNQEIIENLSYPVPSTKSKKYASSERSTMKLAERTVNLLEIDPEGVNDWFEDDSILLKDMFTKVHSLTNQGFKVTSNTMMAFSG